MNKTLSIIFLTALITSSGYCQDIAAQHKESLAIHPRGQNILISSEDFDDKAMLNQVNVGMTAAEVVVAIGLPKEIEEDTWFYTYEFSDKTDQFKWLILRIDFKGNAVAERYWLPNGSSNIEDAWVSIAVVGSLDKDAQEHVTALLGSEGIESYTEGSLVYALYVPAKDAERATAILKSDAEASDYWIQFPGDEKAISYKGFADEDLSVDDLGEVWQQTFRIIPYLRTAIKLQSMSQEEAEATLRAWAQDTNNNEKVAILCRMLFESENDEPLRRPRLGDPVFVGGEMSNWPLEPITIYKDIPICIVSGYVIGGLPEHGMNYLNYSIKNGSWTKRRYTLPEIDEIKQIIEEFMLKTPWPNPLKEHEKSFLRAQAMEKRVKSDIAQLWGLWMSEKVSSEWVVQTKQFF